MKKAIIALLFLVSPFLAWAECENPIGKIYTYDGITIHFVQGYDNDTIAQIDVVGNKSSYLPYVWNGLTCRATLLTEPPIYLDFDESWFDISENPFRFSVIGSMD